MATKTMQYTQALIQAGYEVVGQTNFPEVEVPSSAYWVKNGQHKKLTALVAGSEVVRKKIYKGDNRIPIYHLNVKECGKKVIIVLGLEKIDPPTQATSDIQTHDNVFVNIASILKQENKKLFDDPSQLSESEMRSSIVVDVACSLVSSLQYNNEYGYQDPFKTEFFAELQSLLSKMPLHQVQLVHVAALTDFVEMLDQKQSKFLFNLGILQTLARLLKANQDIEIVNVSANFIFNMVNVFKILSVNHKQNPYTLQLLNDNTIDIMYEEGIINGQSSFCRNVIAQSLGCLFSKIKIPERFKQRLIQQLKETALTDNDSRSLTAMDILCVLAKSQDNQIDIISNDFLTQLKTLFTPEYEIIQDSLIMLNLNLFEYGDQIVKQEVMKSITKPNLRKLMLSDEPSIWINSAHMMIHLQQTEQAHHLAELWTHGMQIAIELKDKHKESVHHNSTINNTNSATNNMNNTNKDKTSTKEIIHDQTNDLSVIIQNTQELITILDDVAQLMNDSLSIISDMDKQLQTSTKLDNIIQIQDAFERVDCACVLVSQIVRASPQSVEQIMLSNITHALLLVHKTFSVRRVMPLHLNALVHLTQNCTDQQSQQLLDMNMIQTMYKLMEHKDPNVQDHLMGLLFNLVFIHNHGPEFFLPHPYLRHLEEDGTISNIFKIGYINQKSEMVSMMTGMMLGWLYKNTSIPQEYKKTVIMLVKGVAKLKAYQQTQAALVILHCMALRQENHSCIISRSFLKTLTAFIKSDDNFNKSCSMAILAALMEQGSEVTRRQVRLETPLGLVKQLRLSGDLRQSRAALLLELGLCGTAASRRMARLMQESEALQTETFSGQARDQLAKVELLKDLANLLQSEQEKAQLVTSSTKQEPHPRRTPSVVEDAVCVLVNQVCGDSQKISGLAMKQGLTMNLFNFIKQLPLQHITSEHASAIGTIIHDTSPQIRSDLIQKGAVQILVRLLKHPDEVTTIIVSTSIIDLLLTWQMRSAIAQPNPFRSQFERDGTIKTIYEDGIVRMKAERAAHWGAVMLGFLYQASPIPNKYRNQLLDQLKKAVKSIWDDTVSCALSAMDSLIACPVNVALILERGFLPLFIQTISTHYNSSVNTRVCALMTLHSLLMREGKEKMHPYLIDACELYGSVEEVEVNMFLADGIDNQLQAATAAWKVLRILADGECGSEEIEQQ